MQIVLAHALSFLNEPYRWGGDDPLLGFDCSGLIQEILKGAGAHPDPKTDYTAQMLYSHFEKQGRVDVWGMGSLAFYGKDALRVTHVAFCVDAYRMIEAGSGGSTTLTLKDASDQNAFVRIRPIKARADLVAVIRPSYAKIGIP